MPRLKDVAVKVRAREKTSIKVLKVDARTAGVVRKIARADGLLLSDFLDLAVRDYLQARHQDWAITEDTDDAASVLEKDLAAARRTRGVLAHRGGRKGR